MERSKLGCFVEHMQPGLLEKIIEAKPRIVKVGDPPLAELIHNELGPSTIVIARNFGYPDDFKKFIGYVDLTNNKEIEAAAKAGATRWVNDQYATLMQAPSVYWEGFNEPEVWLEPGEDDNLNPMKLYGQFEKWRQILLSRIGIHAAIGCFSTGTPPIAPDTNDAWEHFGPALAFANDFKNLLSLHEYGGYIMSLAYGDNQREAMLNHRYEVFPQYYAEGWLACRYRKVWNTHIEPNGWTGIRIAITETGLDMALPDITSRLNNGVPTTSWITCGPAWERNEHRSDTAQFYYEQLKWYDDQLIRDDYMVGATIFTWGSSEGRWRDFDVNGYIGDKLFADMKAMPYPPTVHVVTPRNNLFVRIRPNKLSAAKCILGYGELVEVVSSSAEWSYIKTADGHEGYSMTQYLKKLA